MEQYSSDGRRGGGGKERSRRGEGVRYLRGGEIRLGESRGKGKWKSRREREGTEDKDDKRIAHVGG